MKSWHRATLRPALPGLALIAALNLVGCTLARLDAGPTSAHSPPAEDVAAESAYLHSIRQLTFAGRRSGEGYFGPDGRSIVFQSEREPGNPFYQIYRLHLETGEETRISTGTGKTTCAWIHPDGARLLFASTHLDPTSLEKQAEQIAAREAGRTGRYSWDYDPSYDLFVATPSGELTRLTRARGYDAEASFSPDGRFVAFASNRHAFEGSLSPADRERIADDPQYFMELYLLDLETSAIRRLTQTPGYDGGPFFSPDGQRLTWRRFAPDGATAEIHTMRIDGTDQRVLTRLNVMSWAPFYHPSGDYLLFSTNLHGFDNFELYMVDVEGHRDPVRVTEREGFDGLPSFSPDGESLLWTSNRTADGKSQLFLARWDDATARAALGLPEIGGPGLAPETRPTISAQDLAFRVASLTDPRTEGRSTGSAGEARAAADLERAMRAAGLQPGGDDGAWQHAFTFTAGLSPGIDNALSIGAQAGRLDVDWRPLAFSRSGPVDPAPIVFAGYGLVAPASGAADALDDYADRDVSGRWVLVFRDLPRDLEPDRRRALRLHAGLRHKAMVARDRGAKGLIFVSGPGSGFRDPLVPLRFDASLAGTSIAAISLSDAFAETLLAESEEAEFDLASLQAATDAALSEGEAPPALMIEAPPLTVRIDLQTERAQGVNVLGRLQVGAQPSERALVLGAHYDHLGRGEGSGSLADASEAGLVHPGADDNASGTALLLEIAEWLAARHRQGFDLGVHDFVFAAWSGEELGLLGSDAWVDEHVSPHAPQMNPIAYLNFDMVGRLRDHLVIQGLGSSPDWAAIIEQAAAPLDLSIHPQQDSYVPTDATSFYTRGVPILSAFTGVHDDYHKPSDTLEKLNLEGTVDIGELFTRIAESVGRRDTPLTYQAQPAPSPGGARGGFRVFLGTIPDYARTDVVGVVLSGVQPAGPAEQAGLRRGDVIVEAAGQRIENLYDYTFALEAMTIGEPTRLRILRDGEPLEIEIVPRSRD